MRERALELARGALAALEAARQRIDDLNVFPVPDGDTGTNMTLTARAVVEALERSSATHPGRLAEEAARAALLGARGNSGVILSQIVGGAAGALGRGDGLAATLRAASDAAYLAVREPVEGTMLTAIRELAEEAEAGGDLPALVARGDDCVARTRSMLPALEQAGVVDAGAAGLLELLRGLAAAARGEPPPAPAAAVAEISLAAAHGELSLRRYCTTFVVEGRALDRDALEAALAPLGDSLLVVGDAATLKVHVHTDEPETALALGAAQGAVGGVEVEDMHAEARAREERLRRALPEIPPRCAAVAVAAGAGNRRLVESLGGVAVDGGETMNPSTGELLAALEAAGAPEAVLLPNDPDVLAAAERAAALAPVETQVLPTRSLQEGLAALVAFDPGAGAAENGASMRRAAEGVAAGAVAVASRDYAADGVEVREGGWLGLVDGRPLAGGASFDDVALAVADRLLASPREVLTLLGGRDAPSLDALLAELATRHPGLELEVHDGGQPHYALLLGAE